jgi:hypothetical protein
VDDFKFKGKKIAELKLVQPFIIDNRDNDKAEYLVKVDWKKAVNREEAKWSKNGGLLHHN